jgi:simple sugar transport system permease protein
MSAERRIAFARLRDLALIPPIIVIAIVGQLVNSVFLQTDNIINVLQTMSEIAVLVLAETMVLIVKKMDLSLESTMGLAPGVAAWLTVPTGTGHGLGLLPGGWAVPVTLAVGLAIGAVNALFIINFGLNGFRPSSTCPAPCSTSAPPNGWGCRPRSGSA